MLVNPSFVLSINSSKTTLAIMLTATLSLMVSGCDIKQREKVEDNQPVDNNIIEEVKTPENSLKVIEITENKEGLDNKDATTKTEANKTDAPADGKTEENTDKNKTPAPVLAPVVEVVKTKLVQVPQSKQYAGVVTAAEVAETHPTLTGTISEIYFKQGYWIKAGEPLFKITADKTEQSSAATKEAIINKAEALLESAISANKKAKTALKARQTELTQAQKDLKRYDKLIKDQAVSQQKYEQAKANVNTLEASVTDNQALIKQTDADIKTAEANLELTKNQQKDSKNAGSVIVTAPMTGMILNANINKGKKVVADSVEHFVTIAKVNPVFVDIQPTAEELVLIKEMLVQSKEKSNQTNKQDTNKNKTTKTDETANKTNTNDSNQTDIITDDMVKDHKVSLVLANGKTFASAGSFKFNETKINDDNKITMRVLFPNNKSLLLPNMKVTAKVDMPDLKNVILVPATAVRQTINSTNDSTQTDSNKATKNNTENFVYIVDKNNQVHSRPVEVSGTYGNKLIIIGGLLEGDKVIIDSSKQIEDKQIVSIKGETPVTLPTPVNATNTSADANNPSNTTESKGNKPTNQTANSNTTSNKVEKTSQPNQVTGSKKNESITNVNSETTKPLRIKVTDKSTKIEADKGVLEAPLEAPVKK